MSNKEELIQLWTASAKHISEQNGPSGKAGMCMYKADNGRGCAAAPFIKNYTREMEGVTFDVLARDWPQNLDQVAVNQRSFVRSLQMAHDAAFDVTDQYEGVPFMDVWRANMRMVAKAVGISDDVDGSDLYSELS